jgi:uncharacterized SAM-binding protein YcdF (DUF218 family)
MRTIRKIVTTVLILSAVFLIVVAIIPRKWIVDLFVVQSQIKDPSRIQLVAILGGGMNGEKLGVSTRERLDRSIPFIKKHNPDHLIVCEYKKYQGRLYNYLLKNGIKKEKMSYPTFEYSDSNSGTLNNVLEILDYMKKKQLSEVVVVTSPYHEKRVKLLFDRLAQKNGNISASFLHVNNSEILATPYRCYVSLIAHESAAIAVDWANPRISSSIAAIKAANHHMVSITANKSGFTPDEQRGH